MKSLAVFLLLSGAVWAADVTGRWTAVSADPIYLILKQDGAKLTGSGGPGASQQMPFDSGAVEGDRVIFKVGPYQFNLHVEGEMLKGEARNGSQTMEVSFERAKEVKRPDGAPPPSFEVVSIKPNVSVTGPSSSRTSRGQVTMENVSLWKVIGMAYGIGEDKPYAISGPGWLKSQRFDIVAKIPEGTAYDDVRLMMQTMLADRFKLAAHKETKELPVYVMVVAKGGPRLHASEGGRNSFQMGPGVVKATSAMMKPFADRLSQMVDKAVIDQTGLTGTYDFTLEWTPDDPGAILKPDGNTAPNASQGPTLVTAIEQQLGLKLEARKAPMEILVIDRAEKLPTEN